MGIVGRLDQYASMLAGEFDDYSMSENLVLKSSQIGASPDYSSGGIVGLNTTATTAPNGFNEATFLDNNGNTNNYVFGSAPSGLTTNTTYTYSIHIKQATKPDFTITIDENGFGGKRYQSTFTYSTETITTGITGLANDGVLVGSSYIKYPNNWYKLSLTFTTSTVSVGGFVDMINRFGAVSGSNYVWGRQLERGSTATDYTPTTTTAKTRVLSSTTNTNITGLSTYFSSGFSENVGAATTLVANVFPPYDLVYDDFGGTLFGAGQGRYMRQNTDKSVIVYNEIDEVSDFRDIVRTGLVLDLDAAQPLSYKGTGTTWNDLSGIGNNVSLIGSPTFNSSNGGSIVFNGSNYGSGTSGSSFQFTSDFSVDGWIYPTTISATHVVFDTRVGGAPTTGIAIYINSSSQLVLYNGTTLYITSSTTLPINNWYHFCISRIGSTTTMYVNSSSVGSTNTLPTSLTDGNCFIARTNEAAINYFIGRISSIRSYKNKGLTLTEVLQNYNALKHRFGL